uniref:Uncharacterized protein n=1 Tax=Glossina morsitans morsitans TaxID=37546 RepID=A0ABK9NG79_GLOMM
MSEKKGKKTKGKQKGVGAANRPAMTSALSRCFSFPARGYDNRSCSHFRSCKICMILQSFYSEARTKYYPTTIAAHQRQTSYFCPTLMRSKGNLIIMANRCTHTHTHITCSL